MAQLHQAQHERFNSGINPEDRRRSWLLDSYASVRWTVQDGAGSGKAESINFDVPMADGRSLVEHRSLYMTAKEFVFWIRAGNYTRFDDAIRHKQYGDTMIRLCYGLTARGFRSFGELKTFDIDSICAEAAFGSDGLTGASKVAKKALSQFSSWADVPPSLVTSNGFDVGAVVSAFNLPRRWCRIEVVSEIKSATYRLNGKLLSSVADLKEEPITSENIGIITTIFDALFALRYTIAATGVAFRPFSEGAGQRAVLLGRSTSRTPVPPPELALKLMEESAKYLIRNGAAIVDEYRRVVGSTEFSSYASEINQDLRLRIKQIAVPCYVIVATFTARRTDEIRKLKRGCIKGDARNGLWMHVYIEKTQRKWTWIPVPAIVARAVDILKSFWGDPEGNRDLQLFSFQDPFSKSVVNLAPEHNLNNFAAEVGAGQYYSEQTEKTETWTWITRQFRRFFAVLFFYQYKGKIETLSHHLRHFNLDQTNDYVTLDKDVQKIWLQESWEYPVELARDIVTGRATYSGAMGKRLTNLANRLRSIFAKSVVVVSEVVGAALVRQMRKGQLVLTPKAWVTCTCPRSEKGCAKAACRKHDGHSPSDIGPNFAAAGPTVCPDCPFALFSRENLIFIDNQIEEIAPNRSVGDAGDPSIFAELQAAHLIELQRFRKRL